jgi:hypothetical protein
MSRKVDATAAQLEAVALYQEWARRLRVEAVLARQAGWRDIAEDINRQAAVCSRAAYAELHPAEGA